MEWVETTGKTVEEALDAALDQLGVDAADADYEVLEEPKTGLFGRLRTEARVRARVRPTTPRAKEERRPRSRKAAGAAKADATATEQAPEAPTAADGSPPPSPSPSSRAQATASAKAKPRAPKPANPITAESEHQVSDPDQEVPIAEQGEVAAAFVRGVVERFGASSATVAPHLVDADTVEIRVDGEDLGLLIGPKGVALQSLQELTRTVVQRQTGARSGRVLVDVSGYRQRRKEALERFARKIADDVLASGTRVVLEPMNPSDRKVIHDTMNEIAGVSTSSEGEEPRRRVVVSPS